MKYCYKYDIKKSKVNKISADADAAGTYKGVPAAATVPFALQDYCHGIVDLYAVFIYSASTQDLDIIFQGR